jgi:hypothetical protein
VLLKRRQGVVIQAAQVRDIKAQHREALAIEDL